MIYLYTNGSPDCETLKQQYKAISIEYVERSAERITTANPAMNGRDMIDIQARAEYQITGVLPVEVKG